MSLPRNIFQILRDHKIEIMDFLETPFYLPWPWRIILCKIMEAERNRRLYPGRYRRDIRR